MTDQDLIIVNLATQKLAADELSALWRRVLSFCVDRGVDRVRVELDAKPPAAAYREVYDVLKARLPGHARSGTLSMTPEIADALASGGPGLVSVNLCSGSLWWGGIYDWGYAIAVLLERSAWTQLKEELGGLAHAIESDVEEVLERPPCVQS